MLLRLKTALIPLCVLGLLPGCMTFELSGNAPLTSESRSKSETVHGSIYEYRWRDYSIQKCKRGAVAKVEFHTNALMLAASFVSLGFYVPQTVEWWCADTTEDSDADEPSVDPSRESDSWSRLEIGDAAG